MVARMTAVLALVPVALLAQPGTGMAPAKGAPVVEFKGKIERVEIVQGHACPRSRCGAGEPCEWIQVFPWLAAGLAGVRSASITRIFPPLTTTGGSA